jgi:hypothetical protein
VIVPLAGAASVVLVRTIRASRSSPLCWLLLVGLCSVRRAALVTESRLHGARQGVPRDVDRIERPDRTFLTFDAPNTELIRGFPRQAIAGSTKSARSLSSGIVGCPSSDMPTRVHSTRADARVRTAVCRPRFMFRPCGISPLRRLAPHRRLRACCIPVPDMGFAGFPQSASSPPEDSSDTVRIPTSACTLRRFAPRR